MMRAPLKVFACAAIALLFSACASQAATIIKLDLGGTGPDLNFSGGVFGTLDTVNDGVGATTGDQNTAILYTDFLSSTIPNPTVGSYTLHGATATGVPQPLGGGVVAQNFSGGNFKLFNSANVVLLDVNLGTSLLVGGGNGAFFNITNGTLVAGTLASQLNPNSLGMSMSLTSISGGGLTVGGGGILNSFFANATKEITGSPVPEPATVLLALCFSAVPMLLRRR